MTNVMIMAHRGASYHAPENTKAAFLKAYDFAADGIETDLQLTKDGEIVVHHNYFVDNTSDGKGAIIFKDLSELKKYDFGAYKAREFQGEGILTLAELLPLLKDMDVINLELKSHINKSMPFASKVLQIVEESGWKDKVIYSSFDADLLRQLKQQNPECKVGLLTFYERMQVFMREMKAAFLASYPSMDNENILKNLEKTQTLVELVDSLDYKPDYLHPDYHSVLDDANLVKEMHARGIGVNPYTCDNAEEMQKLIEAGCDGIITNRPDIAREVCGR